MRLHVDGHSPIPIRRQLPDDKTIGDLIARAMEKVGKVGEHAGFGGFRAMEVRRWG